MEGILAVICIVDRAQAEEARQLTFLLDAWLFCITVRDVAIMSRAGLEHLVAFVKPSGLKPIVHDRASGLRRVKDAYEFLFKQKNFGELDIDGQNFKLDPLLGR
jgi:hypothetical protein